MFDIAVWILIAVIGFVVYVMPAWNVRRSYEGFVTQATEAQQTPTIPFNLNDLASLIGTPTQQAENPPASSSGLQAQPEEHASTKSQPAKPTEAPKVSDALQQGKAALQTMQKPAPEREPEVLVKKQYIRVPAKCPPPPPCPRAPKCPPAPACPPQVQCPDMTQYIRKDSIPCWGCKLK
jgi:hypothetical protein